MSPRSTPPEPTPRVTARNRREPGRTVVVMGVEGAGKTTVGRGIAEALGLPFLDADDFHDEAALALMRAGHPLGDRERLPWLRLLNSELRAREQLTGGAVLACSALTARHRRLLTAGLADVTFVVLSGPPELIRSRLAARRGHFAGPELLDSQLATLEIPPDAAVVDVTPAPAEVVRRAVEGLARRGPVGR